MHRLLAREQGQALTLALAFMVLAVPLITSSLSLASTLSVDSGSKTRALKAQYSVLGAQQYARHVSLTQSTPPTTTTMVLNDTTVTTTIVRLLFPPRDFPFASVKKRRLFTSKEADPTLVSPNATTTYVITVENRHKKQLKLTKIIDELPGGFSYVAGSSSLADSGGNVISTDDPGASLFGSRYWSVPGTVLQPGETATMTFDATAASDEGVYCNEAYVRSGFLGLRKTTSGKTAKVTIGSPGNTRCEGRVVTVEKTVEPDLVTGEVETDYTYTITIANEGTRTADIREITDSFCSSAIGDCEFTYKPFSVSSTPSAMNPGEPTSPGQNIIEWDFGSFLSQGERLPPDTTWTLEFEATATLPRGQFPNEVELTFTLWGYLPPMTTWPTAAVSVVEYYQITGTDGSSTYTCNVWLGTDVEGNEIHFLEDCSL